MKIQANDTNPLHWSGDCLGLGFFEDGVDLQAFNGDPDRHSLLQELVETSEFKGKSGETTWTRIAGTSAVKYIVLVGLGKAENFTLDSLRLAASGIARTVQKQKCKTVGIHLPVWNQDAAQSAQAMAEGIGLTLHQDNRFKSEPENGQTHSIPEQVELLGIGPQPDAIKTAHQVCQGVILARELVAAPANVVTPAALAETASAIATEHGLLIEVLGQRECEDLGMGAFLGVSKASELPPKFIHLTYIPSGGAKRKLAIIGKGVTFDSGGLNLKVSGSGIETMKMDMAGSAATLGAAKV
ncbi:MAG: M17 family peptidase N-terminal domain-containing protein, partial [Thermosynechococcaceae cyanobacterium]